MNCFDNLVGLKGLCNNTHNYYVNGLSGITFLGFSEAANSEKNTGAKLFNELYYEAVEAVKTDVLSLTDFKVNYFAKVFQVGEIGEYFVENEKKFLHFELRTQTDDPYLVGKAVSMEFISDKETTAKIYINGEESEIEISEGYNSIDLNLSFKTKALISLDTSCFTIGQDYSKCCDSCDSCNECSDECVNIKFYEGNDITDLNRISNNGVRFQLACECDIDKFLCPYAKLMRSAIRIKIGILLMLEIVANIENRSYFLRATKEQAAYWLSRWEGTTNLQTGFKERSEYWTEIKKIAGQVKMQKSMCNHCKGIQIKSVIW